MSSFVEFLTAVLEKKSKLSPPIRGQGGHLVFLIGPKKTSLVEDVEILLPVKCHWIPFGNFREEVENVSANKRPGRPCYFSDRPEKHKFGRGNRYLASCLFFLIPYSSFRGGVENVSANQRSWWSSCFFHRPEKHKLGRGYWDLASFQVSLNSVQRFQKKIPKCLSQSEVGAAILFFRSARKTNYW